MSEQTKQTVTIELRLFANFRHTVGEKTIHRSYEGESVKIGDVLTELSEEYPDLEFFEEDGSPREYISILKNGQDIVHLEGLDTLVGESDRISLFPPVAGG